MKDEIKEILDKLNNKAEHYILYDYEVKQLLDHITNLQEENDRLKKDYGRLMQDNAYTLELEQRIDKAIEYIGKPNWGDYEHFVVAIGEDNCCPYWACEKLLEILQGSDK